MLQFTSNCVAIHLIVLCCAQECELYSWQLTYYMQKADWVITWLFLLDVLVRLYCLGWRAWSRVSCHDIAVVWVAFLLRIRCGQVRWHVFDLMLVAFDISVTIVQYREL